jgi:hypothetical protein
VLEVEGLVPFGQGVEGRVRLLHRQLRMNHATYVVDDTEALR